MPDLFSDLKARAICAFHDAQVRAPNATPHADDGQWRFVAQNHDANRQLWDQEDLARRGDVPDA
ncbi:MAG TPA: glycosyl transferase, partial [Casimicrobiaceae bacterium]